MKRKLPETSLEAKRSLKTEEVNETKRKIRIALASIGEGTFEDIAAFAKIKADRVWKRLSELLKDELIYRPGNKKVLKSGRNGFTWMLSEKGKVTTESEMSTLKKGDTISDYSKAIRKIQDVTQLNLFPDEPA